jgi:bacillithiol biosynthesis deacetylase BshB1
MKLDILAFAAHPDDVELAASGTLMTHISQGKKVGVVDLTKGELGSRGSAELRAKEASIASKLMNIDARVNLDLGDGFFNNAEKELLKVIEQIRYFQPGVVLCNANSDRHPDHSRGSELVSRACFLAGLNKIETKHKGEQQATWRPQSVFHYIQDNWIDPDFVIDITDVFDGKMDAISAYGSQFFNPESDEPDTPISSLEFMEHIKGRAIAFGRLIGVKYGEGFTVERAIGVKDLTSLK